MVKNIEMDENTLAALRILQSQALRRGVALGPYLQSLAEQAERTPVPDEEDQTEPKETAEQWIARLRAWAQRFPKSNVIADDSRESIYPDRI